ncbi:hypothetical protein AMTR_s00038p00194680 [Amborella trichopoda]|uniref:CCHC-type domain-containing protein n=1 Tax=Amborella trichopoda TaxID=13333 RepID=U5CWW7_AMBTC|nr:hypothetical protein AMTR_s00038p00194680 [Amborella trichopoda]
MERPQGGPSKCSGWRGHKEGPTEPKGQKEGREDLRDKGQRDVPLVRHFCGDCKGPHHIRDCSKRDGTQPLSLKCFICDKSHRARDCSSREYINALVAKLDASKDDPKDSGV